MTKGTAYCVLFVGAVVAARFGFELLSHKTREAIHEVIPWFLLGGLALMAALNLLIAMVIYTLVTQ